MNIDKTDLLNDERPLVIAEIGGNHGGSVELAMRMVAAASAAGAEVVKFQTYRTRNLVSSNEDYFEDFDKESLTPEEFRRLANHCREMGVTFLSTPFDEESADLLEELEVPAFKIASGDLNHLALLRHIAKKNKPIFLSTGASTWKEIDQAVETITGLSSAQLVILHCVAAYPAPDAEANLKVIPEMEKRYGLPVGWSDHTLGIDLALASVALGGRVIEKHFTTDQSLPGGDNEMSILPEDLSRLLEGSRRIYSALGTADKAPTAAESDLLPLLRRSLVVRERLAAGEVITAANLTAVRPATGIPADRIDQVVGKRAVTALEAYSPLKWEDLD